MTYNLLISLLMGSLIFGDTLWSLLIISYNELLCDFVTWKSMNSSMSWTISNVHVFPVSHAWRNERHLHELMQTLMLRCFNRHIFVLFTMFTSSSSVSLQFEGRAKNSDKFTGNLLSYESCIRMTWAILFHDYIVFMCLHLKKSFHITITIFLGSFITFNDLDRG